MLRFRKPEIAAFRADYAISADFCAVFEKDMKPLYLLAFLLTANHNEAEQCFASTVEEAFKKQAVFKEWARTWVKRKLIENAIAILSPVSARTGEKQELWKARSHETDTEGAIDAVTKLAPLERFVFVMSILECNKPRLFSSSKVIFLRLIPRSRAVIARAHRVAACIAERITLGYISIRSMPVPVGSLTSM